MATRLYTSVDAADDVLGAAADVLGVALTFNLTTNTTWFFSLNNEIVFSSPDQVPFLLTIPELLSVEQNPADGGVFVVVRVTTVVV